MNIKTRVIQSNSLSFDIKTIIIRASQQTIMSFKISMLSERYPYKIIQSCMLPFLNTRYPLVPILVSAKQLFHTLVFSNLFNFHAIHEREPWTQHYMWNRMVVVEKTKRRRQSHINQAYQRVWICPSIDINVSEQGLPCNGCTRAISL